MRQRVMIAIALSCEPQLHPVRRAHHRPRRDDPGSDPEAARGACARDFGVSVVFVTHDLAVVAQTCEPDRGHVRRPGGRDGHRRRGVPARRATRTRSACCAPCRDFDLVRQSLDSIPGQPPDLVLPPSGCRFHPRCPFAQDDCVERRVPAAPARAAGRGDRLHPRRRLRPEVAREAGDRRCLTPPCSRCAASRCSSSSPTRCSRRARRVPPRCCARSTASISRSPAARRWGWSASPAAASRRSAAASSASTPPARARSGTTGEPLTARRERAAAAADADRVPGPVLVAQPAHDRAPGADRAPAGAQDGAAQPGRRALPRADRAGRPRAALARRASAQLLGRPAPARLDRPRARARARAAGGRRAGVGARRVRAGDGAEPARRAALEARPDDALHRPQHGRRAARLRPGGGDVPGPDRRDGADRGALLEPPPPLHPGAAEGGAAARARPPDRGGGDGGRPAEPDQRAVGLPLPHRAARSPRRSARATIRRSPQTAAATSPRATSPGRPRRRRMSPRSSPRAPTALRRIEA